MERGEIVDGCFWIERCVQRSAAVDVYRAVDVRDESSVLLRVHTSVSTGGVDHFHRVCAALAASPHPALERVLASGSTSSGSLYAALLTPSGPTLEETLGYGLASSDATPIAQRALLALEHLHGLGIVHGEITTRALLLPLGLATATTLLDVMLVPRALIAAEDSLPSVQVVAASHLAPERVRAGLRASPAADMFALGCVFYRMLTGRLPFASQGVVGTFLRILYEDPEVPALEVGSPMKALASVTMRMLEKDPALRPSAADALAELDGAEPIGPIPEDPASLDSPTLQHQLQDVGLVLCRESARGHASLDREAELDRVARLLEDLGGRLDRLSDGTLLVEVGRPPSRTKTDSFVRAGRAALLLQTALPACCIVVARGGTGARGLEAAEALLTRVPPGHIAIVADLARRLEKHFEVQSSEIASFLWEGEPRTHEQAPSGQRFAGLRALGAGRRNSVPELDNEVTIVEQVHGVDAVQPGLEPHPTLEMDMTALALASVGVPSIQHDDTDQDASPPEETTLHASPKP